MSKRAQKILTFDVPDDMTSLDFEVAIYDALTPRMQLLEQQGVKLVHHATRGGDGLIG